jgi:hypothetical protein
MEIPIIFHPFLTHKVVAEALMSMLEKEGKLVVPVSAGEYVPATGACTGYSESLRVGSRKGDATLIRLIDYTGGIV